MNIMTYMESYLRENKTRFTTFHELVMHAQEEATKRNPKAVNDFARNKAELIALAQDYTLKQTRKLKAIARALGYELSKRMQDNIFEANSFIGSVFRLEDTPLYIAKIDSDSFVFLTEINLLLPETVQVDNKELSIIPEIYKSGKVKVSLKIVRPPLWTEDIKRIKKFINRYKAKINALAEYPTDYLHEFIILADTLVSYKSKP